MLLCDRCPRGRRRLATTLPSGGKPGATRAGDGAAFDPTGSLCPPSRAPSSTSTPSAPAAPARSAVRTTRATTAPAPLGDPPDGSLPRVGAPLPGGSALGGCDELRELRPSRRSRPAMRSSCRAFNLDPAPGRRGRERSPAVTDGNLQGVATHPAELDAADTARALARAGDGRRGARGPGAWVREANGSARHWRCGAATPPRIGLGGSHLARPQQSPNTQPLAHVRLAPDRPPGRRAAPRPRAVVRHLAIGRRRAHLGGLPRRARREQPILAPSTSRGDRRWSCCVRTIARRLRRARASSRPRAR